MYERPNELKIQTKAVREISLDKYASKQWMINKCITELVMSHRQFAPRDKSRLKIPPLRREIHLFLVA